MDELLRSSPQLQKLSLAGYLSASCLSAIHNFPTITDIELSFKVSFVYPNRVPLDSVYGLWDFLSCVGRFQKLKRLSLSLPTRFQLDPLPAASLTAIHLLDLRGTVSDLKKVLDSTQDLTEVVIRAEPATALDWASCVKLLVKNSSATLKSVTIVINGFIHFQPAFTPLLSIPSIKCFRVVTDSEGCLHLHDSDIYRISRSWSDLEEFTVPVGRPSDIFSSLSLDTIDHFTRLESLRTLQINICGEKINLPMDELDDQAGVLHQYASHVFTSTQLYRRRSK